jgi:hypothetical protein
MLCGFVFLVFGIVGMELFKGVLHYRCALDGFVETPGHPSSQDAARLRRQLMHLRGRDLKSGGGAGTAGGGAMDHQAEFDTGVSCGASSAPAGGCPAGSRCMYFDDNPMGGISSFDSVASAFIAFMSCTTFDDWATPMYSLMLAFSPYAWIYFLLIVMIAGFFVVNLFLAVIFLEFEQAQEKIKLDQEASRSRSNTARSATSGGPSFTRSGSSSFTRSGSPLRDESGHGGGPAKAAQADDGAANTGSESPVGVAELANVNDSAQDPAASPDGASSAPLLGVGDEVAGPGCCGLIGRAFLPIATSSALGNFSTGLVLLNMVLMCMPYEGMSDKYADRRAPCACHVPYTPTPPPMRPT